MPLPTTIAAPFDHSEPVQTAAMGAKRTWRRLTIYRLLLVAALVVPALMLGVHAILSYQAARDAAAAQASRRADVLREYSGRLLEADAALFAAIDEEVQGMTFDQIAASPGVHRLLRRLVEGARHVRSVVIMAPDGSLVSHSLEFPAPAVNNADRDYFRNTPRHDGATWLGKPIFGRVSNAPLLPVTRALRDAEGQVGVAGIFLDVASAQAFLSTLIADMPGSVAVLNRSDGVLLAAHPERRNTTLSPDSPTLRMLAEGRTETLTEVRSERDGVRRIYAVKTVPGLPVTVAVGLPLSQVWEAWQRTMAVAGSFTLAAMVALVGFATAALRQARREKALAETLELRVEKATRELTQSLNQTETLLQQKELLLQEIHHRVKNNLQIISSLIMIDPKISETSPETIRRIQAMALIHEFLYAEENVGLVSLRAYLDELCRRIVWAYAAGDRVSVTSRGDEVVLTAEIAVPVALIVNEVITNVLKHAFPDKRKGSITLDVEDAPEGVRLSIIDDGVGLPPAGEDRGGGGLGTQLVALLVAQVEASYRLASLPVGTRFDLWLPIKNDQAGATHAPKSKAAVP